MKSYFILAISILISLVGQAQNNAPKEPNELLLATRQIDFIKQNGVFVRLRSLDRTYSELEKRGMTGQIKNLREKEEALTKEIMTAFNSYFNFCKVYYFQARDMAEIQKGNFALAKDSEGKSPSLAGTEFYFIDPYNAETKSTNTSSTGLTVLSADNKALFHPFPSVLLKRWGPFYITYDQLIYKLNYKFNELAFVREKMKEGGTLSKLAAKNQEDLTYFERNTLRSEYLQYSKSYRRANPKSNKPKNRNSGY